jgi:anion-transporting  ArsA/GET3 family ATPase
VSDPALIFVSGKGGVGKSTIAAGLAVREARRGRRTLLAELGEQSFYEQWFQKPIGHEPSPLFQGHSSQNNLFVCRWEATRCLHEYLLHYLKVEPLVNLFFENRVMKSLVQAAPALREIALLGKITSGLRKIGPKLDFDVIVVDAFATGHFKALMRSPIGLAQAVQFGPMGEQSRSIHNVMVDVRLAEYFVVTLAEELPVQEALELCGFLEDEMHVQPKIILNRFMDMPVSRAEREAVREPHVQSFLTFLNAIDERQTWSLGELNSRNPVKVPQILDGPVEAVLSRVSGALEGA